MNFWRNTQHQLSRVGFLWFYTMLFRHSDIPIHRSFESFNQLDSFPLGICLICRNFKRLPLLLCPSFLIHINSTYAEGDSNACLNVVSRLKLLSFVELRRLVSGLRVKNFLSLPRKQNVLVQIQQVLTLYVCETVAAFSECNTKVYELFDN